MDEMCGPTRPGLQWRGATQVHERLPGTGYGLLLPVLHEAVDQVGAKESGTPSNEVDLHPQWVSNVSTIAAIPLSATVISSPCCCSGFKRT